MLGAVAPYTACCYSGALSNMILVYVRMQGAALGNEGDHGMEKGSSVAAVSLGKQYGSVLGYTIIPKFQGA